MWLWKQRPTRQGQDLAPDQGHCASLVGPWPSGANSCRLTASLRSCHRDRQPSASGQSDAPQRLPRLVTAGEGWSPGQVLWRWLGAPFSCSLWPSSLWTSGLLQSCPQGQVLCQSGTKSSEPTMFFRMRPRRRSLGSPRGSPGAPSGLAVSGL